MKKLDLMYNQGIEILKTPNLLPRKLLVLHFVFHENHKFFTLELAIPDQHFFGENFPKCKKKNGNVKAFFKSGFLFLFFHQNLTTVRRKWLSLQHRAWICCNLKQCQEFSVDEHRWK